MQCLGYRELFAVEDGTHDLETAAALIQQNTRRYAKKQMTWFRNKLTGTMIDMSSDPLGRLTGTFRGFLDGAGT